MRLLSWNIRQGGGSRRAAIAAAIGALGPDLVCLPEVRRTDGPDPLLAGLTHQGLGEHHLTCGDSGDNGLLIASRWPFQTQPTPTRGDAQNLPVPLLEALFPQDLRLMVVHLPQKQAQVPHFETLLKLPPAWLAQPSLLVGDFNCGIPLEDSETRTFACTHLFQELLWQGWVDSWRRRHPREREFSWFSQAKGNGFRYDHALASPSLDGRITAIHYVHSLRQSGLSDHSGLWLEIG